MFLLRNFIAGAVIAWLVCGCAIPRDPTPIAENVPPAKPVTAEEYRLGTGDMISIRVYGAEEELKWERIRLDDSGSITLPFAQVKVQGRTTKEIEGEITGSVRGRLLRNPRTWVNIEEYRPFFVEGQVGRPGAYPFQPGLNVRKAVTIGGGFKERASFEKIFVVREGDTSNRRIRVNLNAPVGPGDTVTVEESMF